MLLTQPAEQTVQRIICLGMELHTQDSVAVLDHFDGAVFGIARYRDVCRRRDHTMLVHGNGAQVVGIR